MSAVVIRIDGSDVTDDVVIRGASFSSLVNGSPGQAVLRVKDVAQTYEFASGGLLTLDVDSVRVWGGYVMSAKKVYALPVIGTVDPPAVTRVWEIVGADHNILFNKRIVFKESDPTGKVNFSYDADTYDDTIINDIFDNYLDIDDDDLTRAGVQRIAKAILDVPGKTHRGLIASAGFTWKQMMDSVQRATGGVYYLDASRDLKYVDVETSTSDYTLTDQPVGAFDVGFQGFTLLENGSDLVNDMMVWGAGNGSKGYVFSRSEDSSSIAEHGRWQLPLVTSGLYRQASADIVADSYVYGTPQSHRGGKDDAISFSAKVFEPKFAAGDVVDVVCGIYSYSDALPIRRMTTTFINPTEPTFDLILGHAIDQPVGIFEFIGSKFGGLPPFPGIDLPVLTTPDGSAECSDEVCGTTEDFEGRTEATTWGRATCGLDWVASIFAPNTISVSGGVGLMTVVDTNSVSMALGAGAPGLKFPVDDSIKTMRFQLVDFAPLGTTNSYVLQFGAMDHPGLVFGPIIGISANDTGPTPRSFIDYTGFHSTGAGDIPGTFWNTTSTYTWTIWKTATGQNQSISNGSTSYSPGASGSDPSFAQCSVRWAQNASLLAADATVRILDIDIPEINRCTLTQFDDFERVVAQNTSTLGFATFGGEWLSAGGGGGAVYEVASGYARFYQDGLATSGQDYAAVDAPGIVDGNFTMEAVFYWESIPTDVGHAFADAGIGLLNSGGGLETGLFMQVGNVSHGGLDTFGFLRSDGGVTYTTHPWSEGDEYRLKWERSLFGATNRVKIWLNGTTEPSSWDIEEVGDTAMSLNRVFIFTQGPSLHSQDLEHRWGNIEFRYDGMPCFPCDGSGTATLDDFEGRTTGPDDWGTASGGSAWIIYDSPGVYVAGGVGTLDVTGGSGIAGVIMDDDLVPLSFHEGQDPDITIRIRVPAIAPDGDSPDTLQLALYQGGVNLYLNFTNEVGYGQLGTDDNNSNGDSVDFTDWVVDTWFDVHWTYDYLTGQIRANVWLATDPEPAGWMLDVHLIPNFAVVDNSFQMVLFAGDTQSTLDFDVISYASDCDNAPQPTLPETGEVCETVSHSGGTDFAAHKAFFSGSLKVWVNGIQQTNFTFTAVLGEFSLTSSIDASDELRICYRANGDPI